MCSFGILDMPVSCQKKKKREESSRQDPGRQPREVSGSSGWPTAACHPKAAAISGDNFDLGLCAIHLPARCWCIGIKSSTAHLLCPENRPSNQLYISIVVMSEQRERGEKNFAPNPSLSNFFTQREDQLSSPFPNVFQCLLTMSTSLCFRDGICGGPGGLQLWGLSLIRTTPWPHPGSGRKEKSEHREEYALWQSCSSRRTRDRTRNFAGLLPFLALLPVVFEII